MGALRLGHVNEGADDLGAAKPYGLPNFRTGQTFPDAWVATRNEREQRRAVFCDLLKRRGAAASVARAWDVTEAVVRKVRDGLAPLTDERIAALPPPLRAAVAARLAAPIQLRLQGF